MQAGDVLADRYRLDDLLTESGGGRFWRAHDRVLHRPVAVHCMPADDERAERLLDAARAVGPVPDRRLLRVLDADAEDGAATSSTSGARATSLDILLAGERPAGTAAGRVAGLRGGRQHRRGARARASPTDG